jgi:CTP synthase (UTP-ammonia lyase)
VFFLHRENGDFAILMKLILIQVSKTQMGGTMRLGSRKTLLQTSDCMTAKLYVEAIT